jgi:hypothetical protein
MTTAVIQTYIDKAKCCAGQKSYEYIIGEQNGLDCASKLKDSQILLLIADALQCVIDGGDCLTDKQTALLTERINQICGCCCWETTDINQEPPAECDVSTLEASVMFCSGSDPDLIPYFMVVDVFGQFAFMNYYYVYEYSEDEITWSQIAGNSWKQPLGDFTHQFYRVTAYCYQGSSTYWTKTINRDEEFNNDFASVLFYKIGANTPQQFFAQPFEFWFPYNLPYVLYVISPLLRISMEDVTPLPVIIPAGLHQSFTIDDSWFVGVTDYVITLIASVNDYTNYVESVNDCVSSIIQFDINMIPQPLIGSTADICSNLFPYLLTCSYGSQDSDVYDTYQWLKDGVILAGETNSTYSAVDEGSYQCVCTKQGFNINSDVIVLTEVFAPDITIAPVIWDENDNQLTDFSSGWTVGSGWSLVGSEMVHSSGTANLSCDGTLSGVANNNVTYIFEFDISGTTGSVDVYLGATLIGTYAAGSGSVTGQSSWSAASEKILFHPTNNFDGGISNVSIIYEKYTCVETASVLNEDYFFANNTIYVAANNGGGFTFKLTSDNASDFSTFQWLGFTAAEIAEYNFAFGDITSGGTPIQLEGITSAGCVSQSEIYNYDNSLQSAVPANGDNDYLPFSKVDQGGGVWRISLASNVGVPSGYVYDQNIQWYRVFNQDTGLPENTLIASGVSYIDTSVGGCYSYQCDGLIIGGFLCFLKL